MESIILLLCIIGLGIFVYGYTMRTYKYKNQDKCNILYVPRLEEKDNTTQMHVLDLVTSQKSFTNPNNIAPRGYSELETIIPPLNRVYDSVEMRQGG